MRFSYSTTACLAVMTAVGVAAAGEPGADTETWFRDGSRLVRAERLGPAAPDAAGRVLSPLKLRYAGTPRAVDAWVDHTAIVTLKQPGAEAEAALGRADGRLLRPLMPSAGLWLVAGRDGEDGLSLAARWSDPAARPRVVEHIVPNLYLRLERRAPYIPNDPHLADQWYLDKLSMTEAWGLAQGDESTTIVVVDSGCDLAHPELAPKLDPGLDVVDGDDDPSYEPGYDGAAHGTECAGLAAAATDNGEGIAGACPGCRLRCVRLLTGPAQPLSASIEAFDFALGVDAAVVTNSWGYVDAIPVAQPLATAISNVYTNGRGGRGALVLFAAGNDDREIFDYELQAVAGVLAIGAITRLDEEASFTNYGNAIDLVAPLGTFTTDLSGPAGDEPGDYTSAFGGTSSACPVAAGASALLVSAAPDKTSAELYDALIRTARPAPFAMPDAQGHDPIFGFGIIDPPRALRDVLGLPEPLPDAGAGGGGGSGGSGGDGGSGGEAASSATAGGGCGCRLAPPRGGLGRLLLCGAVLAWAGARRRRRSFRRAFQPLGKAIP